MRDERNTKKQFPKELKQLHRRIASFEKAETRYKRAEEALGTGGQKFKVLTNNIADVSFALDGNLRCTYWNKASEELTGVLAKEALGKSLYELFPDIRGTTTEKLYLETLRDRQCKTLTDEYYLYGKNCIFEFIAFPSGHGIAVLARDVTEYKYAEEALRESLGSCVTLGIFLMDAEGRNIYINDRLKAISGLSNEESEGFNWSHMVHQDDREDLLAEAALKERKGEEFSREFRIITYQGELKWVHMRAAAVLSENGKRIGRVGTIEDITERKRLEEALRNAAGKWMTIFDSMPGLVMFLDRDHRIIRANKTMTRALGLSSQEILRQQCFRCIHGYDAPCDPCAHTQAMADGKEHTCEIYEPRLGGYFLVSAAPLLDENGTPVGTVHVMSDITERKRAEEERIRLVTAIEQAAETILITDSEGTIQYVNPAFERITGYSREQAVGQNPSILKSDKHDEAFYKEMWNTLAHGEIWKGRFINKKKDGTLYKEDAMISPVRDTSGKIINYVAVKRDVTREVALQKQLRHAEKLATTGKIAATIAHEIKNPIFAISSGIQILQDLLKFNDDEQETLDIIFRQTMRVDRLIKQLLTYSAPQEMNLTPNQIKEIISEVILLNRDLLRSRKIEIREKMPEHMPPALVDKDRITQVLINLLQNAIDVSEEGDCIEITCLIDMKNQHAVIKVKDEGPGIPEDQRGKVFDLFFSTKKESSGMGLAISKRIVLDHGGDIRVEPRKKRGTAMVVELPLGEDSA